MKTLRIALITGPQYDSLLSALPAFQLATGYEVQIAVQLPHVELNERMAQDLGTASGAYDLISTHTKYAPSQAENLLALDDLLSPDELADFLPPVLELCRIDGDLMQLPRNIDARLLFYRADLVGPPDTWEAAAGQMAAHRRARFYGFAFPGRHSGLFGTFYELLGSAGGDLFDADLRPVFQGEAGEWALRFLHRLHVVDKVTPPDLLENWYYDEVSDRFRAGEVLMVGDWPGFYGQYRNRATCAVFDKFDAAVYPTGPAGLRRAYSGAHSFAIPRAAREPEGGLALARYLTSQPVQLHEAATAGHTPVRHSVFAQMREGAAAMERDARRLAALEATVTNYTLIPPRFARYPQVEDILWLGVRSVLTEQCTARDALRQMADEVEAVLK